MNKFQSQSFADVSIIFSFHDKPKECYGFHYLECPCLASPSQSGTLRKTLQTIKKWKVLLKKVVNAEEFHNRDVSTEPFLGM